MKHAHQEETSVKSRRLTRGCIAVLECYQEIPCNVCELACHKGAIKIGTPLTNIPQFNAGKCSGCGLCVVTCPGLAVFLVDPNFSKDEALVALPYEYQPVPEVGTVVDVVNRRGEVVGTGRVLEVRDAKKFDSTLLVTLAIPKKLAQEVRGLIVRHVGGYRAEK